MRSWLLSLHTDDDDRCFRMLACWCGHCPPKNHLIIRNQIHFGQTEQLLMLVLHGYMVVWTYFYSLLMHCSVLMEVFNRFWKGYIMLHGILFCQLELQQGTYRTFFNNFLFCRWKIHNTIDPISLKPISIPTKYKWPGFWL